MSNKYSVTNPTLTLVHGLISGWSSLQGARWVYVYSEPPGENCDVSTAPSHSPETALPFAFWIRGQSGHCSQRALSIDRSTILFSLPVHVCRLWLSQLVNPICVICPYTWCIRCAHSPDLGLSLSIELSTRAGPQCRAKRMPIVNLCPLLLTKSKIWD